MNYRKYMTKDHVSYKATVRIDTCCEVCGVRVALYPLGKGAKQVWRTMEGSVSDNGSNIRCNAHKQ